MQGRRGFFLVLKSFDFCEIITALLCKKENALSDNDNLVRTIKRSESLRHCVGFEL